MTISEVRTNLAMLAGGILGGLLVVRLRAGAQWFELYGVAIVVLLALPLITWLLWEGLAANGHACWPAIAVTVPFALAAMIQIGFWLAFFASPDTGIQLGMGRLMYQIHIERYVAIAAAILAALLALVTWRAIGPLKA